jgi:hypothetical protein
LKVERGLAAENPKRIKKGLGARADPQGHAVSPPSGGGGQEDLQTKAAHALDIMGVELERMAPAFEQGRLEWRSGFQI